MGGSAGIMKIIPVFFPSGNNHAENPKKKSYHTSSSMYIRIMAVPEHRGLFGLNRRDLILSIAVPVTSFGGAALGYGLQLSGVIADAGEFYWGSVIGSILLAYLAWLKPRKDIVSLLAPLYALIIFIIPLELRPNLVLQLLFAASITILMIRLNVRFNVTSTQETEEESMEKYLYDYITRLSPQFQGIDRATAHEIASAVLSFKFTLYRKVIVSADNAIAKLDDSPAQRVLKAALEIVRDRADNLENARVSGYSPIVFSPDQEEFLALRLPPDEIKDKDTLVLNNAILLLYAVAYLESPDDGQALDEHQNFPLQIISSYKEPLNL